MKKMLCLLAAVSALGLCACSINSQGFYDAPEKKASAAADAAEAWQRPQGIMEGRGSSTDIEGCGTFTEILDRKYTFGSGYTNAKLGDTDVLLLSDELFDNGDGTYAALGSEVYCYQDGAPYYLGYVKSGGTANPLAVKDGYLYAAGHHYIGKIAVEDGALTTLEEAWQTFDKEGNASYHYASADTKDGSLKSGMAESYFDDLYAEYVEGETILFDQVAAPAYEELEKTLAAGLGTSAAYSQEELQDAAALVRDTIAGWDRIELNSIRYAGDECINPENLRWMNQLNPGSDYEDVLEILTDFHTPEDAVGAWEPDADYLDYQWWLARAKDGGWELLTWGY